LLMLPQKSGPKIGTALTVACTIVDLGSPVAASRSYHWATRRRCGNCYWRIDLVI
jgi:hypothetical protein